MVLEGEVPYFTCLLAALRDIFTSVSISKDQGLVAWYNIPKGKVLDNPWKFA